MILKINAKGKSYNKNMEENTTENTMRISDEDFAQFKQIENEIVSAQRQIGDLEIRKAAFVNQAGEAMQRYKDFQLMLYKKHDLSMAKSYQINEQTKEFVEVGK